MVICTLCLSSYVIYPYGGPGGGRTRVQNAFTLKGLQQFFKKRNVLLEISQLKLLQ
jgi:hypothetical protein